MYAVVKTGGKQYRVAEDDVIVVERLVTEAGADVEFDQVLLLNNGKETMIGTPLVDGARVAATVLDQSRADKIIVFKKKRRKDYRRTKGHRQHVTVLRITDILGKGEKRSAAKAKAKTPVKAEAETAAATATTAAAAPEKPAAKAAPKKAAPAKKDTKSATKPAAKKAAPKKPAAKKPAAKKAAAKPKGKK